MAESKALRSLFTKNSYAQSYFSQHSKLLSNNNIKSTVRTPFIVYYSPNSFGVSGNKLNVGNYNGGSVMNMPTTDE